MAEHPDSPSLSSIHSRLSSGFTFGKLVPLAARRSALLKLRDFLVANKSAYLDAHFSDLHKPVVETLTYDLLPVTFDIAHLLSKLRKLSRPQKCTRDFGPPVHVEPHPKGVVLIFGPFNFPIQLVLRPLVAAIAAGNAVCVKPSELAPKCEQFVARLADVLDPDVFAVVTGGPEVSETLLKLRWDHILFTGSGRVGKIVLSAAADMLTPVTLELGGKCAAIVTASAHLPTAASSIVKGRFLNSGQVCLASDYCLIEDSIYDQFVRMLVDTVRDFYTDNPATSDCYSRLISTRHWNRITGLLKDTKGRVLVGGEYDDENHHFVAPTIIEVNSTDDAIMQEEIFGPILPVMRVSSVDEAVAFVNSGDISLALYLFCNDKDVKNDVIRRTRSGSVGVNETILQIAARGSHLGGVGESGMGKYGFSSGFETFSHRRPVMYSTPFWARCLKMMAPKYFGRNNKGKERKLLIALLHFLGRIPRAKSDSISVEESTQEGVVAHTFI